ncbi:MAG TPA: hypothetical protein PLZ53_04335 [Candidatus Hydrogenedentes bacterium]|nr:MAG: hypothetical protein BWY07_01235 [Candidatus Hydrogenedentes bacterium ADurb.Bin170]HNZ49032.1 hypothetical protein [Candidatus Hydrogenedentota bacterium]HOD94633.1 hypothetical protein [Candidatus Hydrogenedentota bacterium]HOH42320.1 hypothetical protein [Candidatus Hydrogenedentota bacterium]HOM49523.1 hypothetical protein [Candidatus Hydrogenedentota bacterium]
MRKLTHIKVLTETPEQAQISNFQVKLEFTSSVIDRLLLADRQVAWKIIPGQGTDTDTDITGTDIPDNITRL